MTHSTDQQTALDDFERQLGVTVSAFEADRNGSMQTLIRIEASVAQSRRSALVLIYDLSDSSQVTAKLVSRLPALIAGWPREWPVWVYALADRRPLQSVSTGNVGHVQDGSLDLLEPFSNAAAIESYRSRGSFLSPTLAAINDRITSEDIPEVQVVLIGDAQLTDFTPANVLASMNLLAMVDSALDVDHCRLRWREVAGDAPLHAFDDPALDDWFAVRRSRSESHRWLRVAAADGQILQIGPNGSDRPLNDAWFEFDFRQGPFVAAIAPLQRAGAAIEARLRGGVVRLPLSTVALDGDAKAATISEVQEDGRPTVNGNFNIGFDSKTGDVASVEVWDAAAQGFKLAESSLPWDRDLVARLLPKSPTAAAILCLTNHTPETPPTAADRLLVIELRTPESTMAWIAGQKLPFGRPLQGWSIHYDPLEDRWMLTIVDPRESGGDAARRASALHPIGSQRLPAIEIEGATPWVAVFSGPFPLYR